MSTLKVRNLFFALLSAAIVMLAVPCMAFAADLQAGQLQDQAVSDDTGAGMAVAGLTTQASSGSKATSAARPFANGWYYIQSVKDSALMLSNQAGSNVVVKNDAVANYQRWYLKFDKKKKAYTLKNEKSGMFLAAKSAKKGANAMQRSSSSGVAKLRYWKIVKVSAGNYALKSLAGNYYLDINGGKKIKSGANVDIAKRKSGKQPAHQTWLFLPVSVNYSKSDASVTNGIYSITFLKSNEKVVTVPGNTKAANRQVVSSKYDAGLNQKFKIAKEADGTYTLQSLISGKFLAVNAASRVVQVDKVDGDATQKWRVVSLGGAAVSFVNASTGDALSISGASTKNGAKAVAADPENVPAQRFLLKKRKLIDDGYYYLLVTNPNSDNGATLKDVSTENDVKLEMKETTRNVDCKFKIKSVGGNAYTITNVFSDKKLVVDEKSVVQSSQDGNAAKWLARMLSDGGITFVNAGVGLAMRSSDEAGAAVRVVKGNAAAPAQHWYPKSTDTIKDYQLKAYRKVVQRGSSTNYYFVVDVKKHRMMKFKRKAKNQPWMLDDEWIVSTGRVVNGVSKTPLKDSKVYSSRLWLHDTKDHRWSAKYATWWNGAHFHSITYRYHTESVSDGRLGKSVSNGCVRMAIKYCKWIYAHSSILRGSGVTVWASGKYKL